MNNKLIAAVKSELNIAHKHELRGTIARLDYEIQFELAEIKLYLDRPEPNIQGALNRVKDIKAILSKYIDKAKMVN